MQQNRFFFGKAQKQPKTQYYIILFLRQPTYGKVSRLLEVSELKCFFDIF
jgi:hypothetical protein